MKRSIKVSVLLTLAAVIAVLVVSPAVSQDKPADNMQILRDKVKADKKLLVAVNMDLTESEAKGFWPIYEEYQRDLAAINRRIHHSRVEIGKIADEKLDLVGLGEHAHLEAKNLNVIQKKRLEIARALATDPKLLMLDEVLGGLNTQEIVQATEFIRILRDDFGLTVFWIEHVKGAIMKATDRVIVLDQGKILMTGTPEETSGDPRVIQAYLGE